jgi:hypothetical protein
MTPEQHAFAKVITRVMRIGGKLFLVFWLLTCGTMAVVALCALLGVPERAAFSNTPSLWAGVLFGSLAAAGFGYLFMQLWRRTLDRFCAHIPDAPVQAALDDSNRRENSSNKVRLSTTAHVGLQIVLSLIGGLAGFAISIVLSFNNTITSQLASVLVFVLLVGVGAILPRLIMLLVPARCPNCLGRAYCRGSRPITFVCRECRHNHNTGISIEAGDGNM